MLSNEQVENATIEIVVTLIVVLFFGFFSFVVYQVNQTENNRIEYCREMKIQPKDCK